MSTDSHNSYDAGIVFRKNSGSYTVHHNGQMISCRLANHFRKPQSTAPGKSKSKDKGSHNDHGDPIAVGDEVFFRREADGSGTIEQIQPRRSWLSRRTATPMPGAHAFEQVIAANIDLVVPVFAATRPLPKWNMLDRYLTSAESLELPSLICITKLDLAQAGGQALDEELLEEVETYRRIGYPVLLTSSVDGSGMDALKQALAGKTAVFVGKSGVGKTSLLNALQPGLGMRVSHVSDLTGKGRHTTSYSEMYACDFGGAVVDTPGVREFGLWDVERDDLAMYFPEMREFLGRCKFGLDCRHEDEPGCAIRKAVMAGQISPRRYQSYLRLTEEGYFE